MAEWDEQLMWAKYHLSVAKRLLDNFENYETKRFLSGCMTEMAMAATGFVNAYLIYFHFENSIRIPKKSKDRVELFKQLGERNVTRNILKIFEIRRAQKNSPIELLKGDKILLLDRGEYKALTRERLGELIMNLENDVKNFVVRSEGEEGIL